MPLYTYNCKKHGSFDYFCPYEERDRKKRCPHKLTGGSENYLDSEPIRCGRLSERIPHRVSMQPDTFWPGKYDHQLGKSFTRKSERKEYMSKRELNGVGVFEECMSTDKFDYSSSREQADRKFDTPQADKEREQILREAIKEVEERRGEPMEKALKREAKERIRGST